MQNPDIKTTDQMDSQPVRLVFCGNLWKLQLLGIIAAINSKSALFDFSQEEYRIYSSLRISGLD